MARLAASFAWNEPMFLRGNQDAARASFASDEVKARVLARLDKRDGPHL